MPAEMTYLIVVHFPRDGGMVTGQYVTDAVTPDKAVGKVRAALAKAFKLRKASIKLDGIYRPDAHTDAVTIY